MIRRRQVLLAASCAVPFVGCSVFPDPPTPQIYRLNRPSPMASDLPHRRILRRQLVIDLPTASESLDSDRIALIRGRTKFDFYANSLWTDRVPVLIQTLLVEAFEGDGGITQVGRGAQDLTPDYVLATDVRKFEASYGQGADQPPTVVISLSLGLIKMPDHRMLARTLVTEESPASSNSVESVAEAFDVAVGRMLLQCVTWTTGIMRRGT